MVKNNYNPIKGDSNRMGLNAIGNKLYLTGLKGTTIFSVGRDKVETFFGLNSNLRSTMIAKYPEENNMIIQEPNTNDIKLCNRDLSEMKRLKGNFREATGTVSCLILFRIRRV